MIELLEKKPEKFAEEVRKAAQSEDFSALLENARAGKNPVTVYAAAFLAIKQGIGITPFDSQIITGGYLDDGAIAELPTGEGKTAAAVFAAFYSVCKGEQVHILTFNDYLARRDREWMKPAYDLLGVSTAFVTENSTLEERKKAYKADVVYVTAKECGFDYLRDFLTFDKSEMTGVVCDRAIVDEADSVLIDEARVPLVAAGIMEASPDEGLPPIFDFAKTLTEEDYEVSRKTETVFLTEKGNKKAESFFKTDNIYNEENAALLEKLIDCLKALHYLTEDKDYIVKDGQIKIIDEFTGRIAENRSYPGSLQAAAELKHGLTVTERGVIMAKIPVQFFLRQYRRISGMTGTAKNAEDEFDSLYGLIVKTAKPNKPSIRKDLPMAVYYDTDAKLKAVVREVIAANKKGQPVLVGTSDIEQSNLLSDMLKNAGIEHSLLNAKNDELEAEIISNAGAPFAVTISTNMAGRGVDIRLGGADESRRSEALAAGGLYVIGTFLGESCRINNQLSGRAARQGDPGQSRLFVSLDEEIMTKHKLNTLIPEKRYPEPTEEEITDKLVAKEILRIQRISQGDALDDRERIMKFTAIEDMHRELMFNARQRCISGENPPRLWQEHFPEEYEKAVKLFGAEAVEKTERKYAAAMINQQWSEYLEYTSSLKNGIHLTAMGGKKPSEEYNIACGEYYEGLEEQLIGLMGEGISELLKKSPEGLKIPAPKRIFTYLLEDSGDELTKKGFIQKLLEGIPEDDPEFAEYFTEDEEEYEETEQEYEAEDSEEEADLPEEEEKEQNGKEKGGFFAKLFGKKK